MANFELDEETKRKQASAQTHQDALKKAVNTVGGIYMPDEIIRNDNLEHSKWQAESDNQAQRGGVETADAVSNAGGIAGFFGGKEKTTHYTAGKTADTTTAGNIGKLDALALDARNRQNATMQGAQIGPDGRVGNISTQAQDQTAARQNALLDQLAAASRGDGPSAAQQQLKMGADRAMASNLSMAAAGGTPGSMRQAAFNNAAAQQDLAGQSSMLRAQEMNDARGLLGNVAGGVRAQDQSLRGQDIGIAQLNQNQAMTQAGLNQDTNKTNLIAGVDQQKQKDSLIQQYVMAGMNLEQAQRQAEIQQAQFNAELLARQSAADKGVAMQSSAQGGQTLAAIGTAIGTVAAAASDKRAKKNVEDGDKSIERFLDSVRAKDWDYKDPAKHGEGRRTGIMAQDAEKNSDMVFTHTDGVKMLDLGKATSTSLAALANINKRLRALET